MRRNMAQSLFQYGQIETTLIKAKEIRPFVERLITLARRGTLQSRQQIIAMLNDRSAISRDEQEKYDGMSSAQRQKVLASRSGRRHRAGKVPASYNKKAISFVAKSVVHQLIAEVAPKFADRPGGYTRIIRLPKRRVGDNSELALLQLVGQGEEAPKAGAKKTTGRRRQKTIDRVRILEGKAPQRRARGSQSKATAAGPKGGEAPPATGESAGGGEEKASE
jgi:large subunit ribosomal protein L17